MALRRKALALGWCCLAALLLSVASADTKCPEVGISVFVRPGTVSDFTIAPSDDGICLNPVLSVLTAPAQGGVAVGGQTLRYTASAAMPPKPPFVKINVTCTVDGVASTCSKNVVFFYNVSATTQGPLTALPTTTAGLTTAVPTTTMAPTTTTAAPPTPAPTTPSCLASPPPVALSVNATIIVSLADGITGTCLANIRSAPSAGILAIAADGQSAVYLAGPVAGSYASTLLWTCGNQTCTKVVTFVVFVPTTTTAAPTTLAPPTPIPTAAPTPVPAPPPLLICQSIIISGTSWAVSTGPVGAVSAVNLTSGLVVSPTCASMALTINQTTGGIASYQLFVADGNYTLTAADPATGTVQGTLLCNALPFCQITFVVLVVAPTPAPTTTLAPPTAAPTTQAPNTTANPPTPTTAAPTTTASPPTPAPTLPTCFATYIRGTVGRVTTGPLGSLRWLNLDSGLVNTSACSTVAFRFLSSTYGTGTGSELALISGNYSFVASIPGSGIILEEIWCDYQPLCVKSFMISAAVAVPPTDAPPLFTTSAAPPTPVPTLRSCDAFTASVLSGGSWSGTAVTPALTAACPLLSFALSTPASPLQGTLQVNSRGDVIYQAPAGNVLESADITVQCLGQAYCRLTAYFQVFTSLTPVPTPQPPTPPPSQECPRAYYTADQGQVLSDSLRGRPEAPVCNGVRSFSLRDDVRDGVLVLQPTGDFSYDPPYLEDVDDFGYNMYCDGTLVCVGRAYIMTSNVTVGGAGTPAPSVVQTQAPVTFVPSAYVSCSGSCLNPWLVDPLQPSLWDDTPGASPPRKDGRPVDSVDVYWVAGGLQILVFTKIGSLSQRFPTFERILPTNTSLLSMGDVIAVANPTSPAFNTQCLVNQPTDVGLGAEVWTITAAGQRIGPRYRRGRSWYQKFGGVHQQCDTFANGCNYAPLLTPRTVQTPDKGIWSVNIEDCDVTWSGLFPYGALVGQKRVDGSAVWSLNAHRRMQATMYSEAVKPNSWVAIPQGFAARVNEFPLTIDLQQWVSATTQDSGASSSPFTIDAQFFEYTTDGRDRAFGLNLLFYPTPINGQKIRFLADRRVRGFRVTQESFTTPDASQCPTCSGKGSTCQIDATLNGDDFFSQDEMQPIYCEAGQTPRIVLSKGPMMTTNDCVTSDTSDLSKVYGQRGFSAPTDCASTFQNLTIRGVAAGSGQDPNRPFSYEGSFTVQLLLTNGNRVNVKIDMSLFVTMLSVGAGFTGSVALCRSSPYWPVLDPLGTSLPDDRFRLSAAAASATAASSSDTQYYLCIDSLDRSFGPTGWAVIGFSLDGYDRTRLRVEQLGLKYDGAPTVFFIYNDPITGAPKAIPSNVGDDWKLTHPYFNFRDVTYRVANGTVTSPDGTVMNDVDFAFALNPGVIDVQTDIEIFCVLDVLGDDGTVLGRPTLRQRIHVDPQLTALSRYGPATVRTDLGTTANGNAPPMLFFIAAGTVIGVVALGVAVLAKDNDRPLPKWVPKPDFVNRMVTQIIRRRRRPWMQGDPGSPMVPASSPQVASPSRASH